ncbi:MAG: AAA family ATPase [Clostridia bacterium]|nr:AAA family ATPase [Clostridia bacterium]
MKIDYLKINGFGKLNNKEINLNRNINVIYGKNESGKSTMLNFINSMFYGASKTKNGKDISDFDKFIPWNTEKFSGKLKYTLDDGNSYEIYRDFKKKAPLIYNDEMQDISLDFNADKNKGIDFLYEQVGVNESLFKNTVITPQNDIKIDKANQNVIIQKISNIVSSGDETISFKKTVDTINKLQNENVGTDRTSKKPINIVNDKIENLTKEKEELEAYKDLLENSINESSIIEQNILEESAKLEFLKKYRENLEYYKLKDSEIDIVRKVEAEYQEKINELENKIDKKSKKIVMCERKSFRRFYILFALSVIITIISILMNIGFMIPILLSLVSLVFGIITLVNIIKFKFEKKSKISEIEELEGRIQKEIDILAGNKNNIENEIKFKEDEINQVKEIDNNNLKMKFENVVNSNFLDMALSLNLNEVVISISNKEELINNLKVEAQNKNMKKEQMQIKVNDFIKTQELLESAIQEKEELLTLNNSFNIAKECMEKAYEDIRSSMSPEFVNRLSNIINKISNGNYENISFSDTDGLMVEIEDGRYVPVERLSQGTIDQMYLALRLSSIDIISKENLPVVLDETFVYFDDERLKNILEFINEFYKEKQIIIFSCSDREKIALSELKIKYNYVELEK